MLIEQIVPILKKEGYDGIEIWWPAENKKDELFAALKKHQLEVGFLCGGWQSDPKEHLDYYKKMVDAAAKESGRVVAHARRIEREGAVVVDATANSRAAIVTAVPSHRAVGKRDSDCRRAHVFSRA